MRGWRGGEEEERTSSGAGWGDSSSGTAGRSLASINYFFAFLRIRNFGFFADFRGLHHVARGHVACQGRPGLIFKLETSQSYIAKNYSVFASFVLSFSLRSPAFPPPAPQPARLPRRLIVLHRCRHGAPAARGRRGRRAPACGNARYEINCVARRTGAEAAGASTT